MEQPNNNNTTTKQSIGTTMAAVAAMGRTKKGPIETDKWQPNVIVAWGKTMECCTKENIFTFLTGLKVYDLNDAAGTLKSGLAKGGSQMQLARPTITKKNEVGAFQLVANTLKKEMVAAGCDMRAFTAGTILRIPDVATMFVSYYQAQMNQVVPNMHVPVLYTSSIANVLTSGEFGEMFSYRFTLFKIFLTAMGKSCFKTRASGNYKDGYYAQEHKIFTDEGAQIFDRSLETYNTSLSLSEAISLLKEAGDDKQDEVRKYGKAFLIGGLLINPKKIFETSDVKQNNNKKKEEFVKAGGSAMASVCYLAKVEVPEEGFDIGNKESESMKAFWTAFTKLKDTRRALLSRITKKGGANTRVGIVAKGEAKKGFQLF